MKRALPLIVAILLVLLFGLCVYVILSRMPQPLPQQAATFVADPRTKTAGCLAHDALPDHACSPGAIFTGVTAAQVCVKGYSASVRNVPESQKRQVFAEYGISEHLPGAYEVDHIVSLELGGSNAIGNLFPEAAEPRPGFHEKDTVENALHRAVCDGRMALADAERLISTDWRQALH